jgi:hypothetical protein
MEQVADTWHSGEGESRQTEIGLLEFGPLL